jgi:hypothetical protein
MTLNGQGFDAEEGTGFNGDEGRQGFGGGHG